MPKSTKEGYEPSAVCSFSVRRFVTLSALQLIFAFLSLSSTALAVTNPQTWDDVTNSATIPDSTVTTPVLRTPKHNSTSNNPYEQFSWTRSTSDTGVSHYTLYLDSLIEASYVTHATSQNTSQFTATVDSNNVYLNFKTPLSEGEHTWYVIAYGSQGDSATSETKTFYIDATTPIIILQAVDKNTMYWATNDPFTIPPYNQRHLTVTTKNPLLSGKIEALSNFKLSLCQGSDPCHSITVNDPDGEWEHRFYNLIKNVTYTAYLSATDAAGNSNIFPEFTITYTPIPFLPFLSAIIKPTPRISPRTVPTARVTAPTGAGSSEVESELLPPPPPPPPPSRRDSPGVGLRLQHTPGVARTLLLLSLFSLLLHLTMTAFGAGIRPRLIPQLLYILFNPFLSKDFSPGVGLRLRHTPGVESGKMESSRTPDKISPPLTTILLYDPNTQKLLHATLKDFSSDGSYRLSDRVSTRALPRWNPANNSLFLKATFPGYEPFTTLFSGGQFVTSSALLKDFSSDGSAAWVTAPPGAGSSEVESSNLSITLNPKPSLTPLEQLQKISLATRSIPLGISLISAIIFLILSGLTQNLLPALILLLAGSDLLYTQYLAPKTK